jgi:hypothetical protein
VTERAWHLTIVASERARAQYFFNKEVNTLLDFEKEGIDLFFAGLRRDLPNITHNSLIRRANQ